MKYFDCMQFDFLYTYDCQGNRILSDEGIKRIEYLKTKDDFLKKHKRNRYEPRGKQRKR